GRCRRDRHRPRRRSPAGHGAPRPSARRPRTRRWLRWIAVRRRVAGRGARRELTMTRVLVVEDNADLAFAVTTALQSDGFDVVIAGTGPEGVERGRARDADLIILDLMLPGF